MTDFIIQETASIFGCSKDQIQVESRLPGEMSNYAYIIS